MDFSQALSSYRTFDPAGWVLAYRLLPIWAGALLAVLGGLLLVMGGGRFFRLVAGPLGVVVGTLWGATVFSRLGLTWPQAPVTAGSALVLGALGFAFPPALVFFAVGLPLGLFAGELAGTADFALAFVPTFVLTGALAAVFTRYIGSVVSSVAGAWCLVLGLLGVLHPVGTLSATVAAQPLGVLIGAGLFATAGSIYQLAIRPSPEEAERRAREKAQARRRQDEKAALEKRWANYSADRDREP